MSWLAETGFVPLVVEPMQGDVSTRTYLRIRLRGEPESLVVACYPPELRGAQERFAAAAELLTAAGIPVPRLLRDDRERGFALLEDAGPSTLHERYGDWSDAAAELEAALGWCAGIAQLDPERVSALGSPPLDATALRRELEPVTRLLFEPNGLVGGEWARGLDALCSQLGAPSLVPCHRDFMARNLVPDGRGGVILLDFQDLRLGPATYDLASLLNDSIFASRELEERIVGERCASPEERLLYGRAVVQRSLKAAGTYLRFAERGMRRHLPLVRPTLERAGRWLPELPEMAEAFTLLRARWQLTLSRKAVC